MIHHCQRLTLSLEPRDHRLRIHAELEDFQRHAPPHRFLLFREINHTTPAAPNALHQAVTANAVPGLFRDQTRCGSVARVPQEISRAGIRGEQPFHFLSQRAIAPASTLQKCCASRRVGDFSGISEDLSQ